jgi:hypothetical protein
MGCENCPFKTSRRRAHLASFLPDASEICAAAAFVKMAKKRPARKAAVMKDTNEEEIYNENQ